MCTTVWTKCFDTSTEWIQNPGLLHHKEMTKKISQCWIFVDVVGLLAVNEILGGPRLNYASARFRTLILYKETVVKCLFGLKRKENHCIKKEHVALILPSTHSQMNELMMIQAAFKISFLLMPSVFHNKEILVMRVLRWTCTPFTKDEQHHSSHPLEDIEPNITNSMCFIDIFVLLSH